MIYTTVLSDYRTRLSDVIISTPSFRPTCAGKTKVGQTCVEDVGETKLFESLNQLNQLLCKMIHYSEALETPHADQNGANEIKTQSKHA